MSSSAELEAAIRAGDGGRVEQLVADNPQLLASPSTMGVSWVTAACYYGQPEIARVLAKGKAVDLFEACALGSVNDVRAAILDNAESLRGFSPDGFPPLALAAHFGHGEIVEELLRAGVRVDEPSQNSLGVTPLHAALSNGHVRVARTLIERGASVRAASAGGWTPLHYAADLGDAELASFLLTRGANPEAMSKDGRTAGQLAIDAGHEHVAEAVRAFTG